MLWFNTDYIALICEQNHPIKEIVTINIYYIIDAYPMHKAIKPFTRPRRVIAFLIMLLSQACSTPSGKAPMQPDPEMVQQASIMTNKCLLNYHNVPGSLSQRQECLNRASALLLDAYGPEIQKVARLCAQKLAQLAADTDAGRFDLKSYQQQKERLQIDCAQAAQAAQR